MKKWLAVTLGVLTAIGGFVDIGDLVTNALVGARFGLKLAWVVLVGVIGICLFAEMSGRIAATSKRPTFDLIRERLGPRTGLVALIGSFLVTALTMTAEIGGVALAIEMAVGLNYLFLLPVVLVLVWLVIFRVRFSTMETAFGLCGLLLISFAVALVSASPDWGSLFGQATSPGPTEKESWPVYWYYAIALFGAAMTPYEVFFFSSGGVEEGWTRKDLGLSRLNVFVGFPLGGFLSLAIAGLAGVTYLPHGIEVGTIAQTALPVAVELGKVGLIVVILGIVAATFGAALETALSSGYAIAQYFGWQWGKYVKPGEAPRFHTLMGVVLVVGTLVLLTSVDPVMVTEYSVVFSAVALPLTYFPILVIANDPDYVGEHTNRPVTNVLATGYLGLVLVASLAAIPLMIVTKAGA